MRTLTFLSIAALSSMTSSCLISGAVMRTQRTRDEVTLAKAVQLPSAAPATLRLALHGNLRASTGPGVYLAEISPWPPGEGADGVPRAYVDCRKLRFLGPRPPEESGRALAIEGDQAVIVGECPGHDRCEAMLLPSSTLGPVGWLVLPFAAIADVVTFPIQVPIYFYSR
jgi:hypothetical protein